MKNYKLTFVYGFAIFAMFFGSGNLVFPLKIGFLSGNNWLLGFIGLFITGILLPFLGVFVIKLHKGNYYSFFKEAGSVASVLLPLFTLSLLGAFGVVPRCITVAHGGISYILPQISLSIFSLLFCCIVYLLCLNEDNMIKILGKLMSPLLLISLTILIIVGFIYAPDPYLSNTKSAALLEGFLTGYQTMDLFAAFFFSSLIFKQIQNILPENKDHRDIIKIAIKPNIIGAIMLSVVYLGFVYLGAHYGELIKNADPELMLPKIAAHTLGKYATFIISTAITFSCLTTAVALNNIYAKYIINFLKLKSSYFPIILFLTTTISFIISLLDFKKISAFLLPMLEISYPGLIVLTILCLFIKEKKLLKTSIFYAITIIAAIFY